MTSFHLLHTKGCLLPHWITASKPAFTNHSPYHRSITASPFQLFQYFNSVCRWLSSQHLSYATIPAEKGFPPKNTKYHSSNDSHMIIEDLIKNNLWTCFGLSISIPHLCTWPVRLDFFKMIRVKLVCKSWVWSDMGPWISWDFWYEVTKPIISGTLVLGGNHFKSRFTMKQFHGSKHSAHCFQFSIKFVCTYSIMLIMLFLLLHILCVEWSHPFSPSFRFYHGVVVIVVPTVSCRITVGYCWDDIWHWSTLHQTNKFKFL